MKKRKTIVFIDDGDDCLVIPENSNVEVFEISSGSSGEHSQKENEVITIHSDDENAEKNNKIISISDDEDCNKTEIKEETKFSEQNLSTTVKKEESSIKKEESSIKKEEPSIKKEEISIKKEKSLIKKEEMLIKKDIIKTEISNDDSSDENNIPIVTQLNNITNIQTNNNNNYIKSNKKPKHNVSIESFFDDLDAEEAELMKSKTNRLVKYKLNAPSPEQQLILESMKKNDSFIINSVAGSGKTTLCFHISKLFKSYKILLITYNERLKSDTRKRSILLGTRNLEVHGFHSFVVKYYDPKGYRDLVILDVLERDLKPTRPFQFDILILDEAQDMRPYYFQLICKIIANNSIKCKKIVLIGDTKQCIYDFMGADSRFISLGNEVFQKLIANNNNDTSSSSKFLNMTLSVSFRVTNQVCDFLNKVVFQKDFIFGVKNGPFPKYYICNSYTRPYDLILHYIRDKKEKPEDIFVLAYSVKSEQSPIKNLSNLITSRNQKFRNKDESEIIPIYIPKDDEQPLVKEALKGKLVFSTMHSVKGLERKIVIILGFDSSYYEYYAKDQPQNECPNLLYVALTRATSELVLIHHEAKNFLPFLSKDKFLFYKYCEGFTFLPLTLEPIKPMENNIKIMPVTNLIEHLKVEAIKSTLKYFNFKRIKEPTINLTIPNSTTQKDGVEEISDINGLSIVAYFEYYISSNITIWDRCNQGIFVNNNYEIQNKFREFVCPNPMDTVSGKLDIEKLLQLSNFYIARSNGVTYRLDQIQTYKWMNGNENFFELSKELLIKYVSLKDSKFEVSIQDPKLHKFTSHDSGYIHGAIDCVDHENKIVYEFKCVDSLDSTHFIQLACYAYLFSKEKSLDYRYILLNILTEEAWEITFDSVSELELMIDYLVKQKYAQETKKNNDIFIDEVKKLKQKYFSID